MQKLIMLFAALLCVSGVISTGNALTISIGVGDQPYYVHGPGYWVGGVYWVWIPGYWTRVHHHRIWIHGHYEPR